MKVLLTNPGYKQNLNKKFERYYIRAGTRWPHSGVKLKGQKPHYLPFPFFLAYSASLLKEAGFEVIVLDAVALDISEDDFLKKLFDIQPDVVFYEITTPTSEYDLSLAEKIKQTSKSLVILGGAHATVFAKEIIRERKEVDYIIKGEYELTLKRLLKVLRGDGEIFPPGVVYRKDSEVIDSGHPEPIIPLDLLPHPLREVFPSDEAPAPWVYWDGFCQLRPAIQMQSSRGCLYNCYFCLYKQVIYPGCGYRAFEEDRVVDEMEKVINKYNVKEIYFDDDDFTADRTRVFSLCKKIIERKLNIKWSCMVNVVNLDQKLIKTMADSGCIGIKFGIESGSESILKNIGKPIDLKKIQNIIKNCRRFGVKTQAAFSIGLLNETIQDINATKKLIGSLAVDSVQVSIATPYPGTMFYEKTKEKISARNISWLQYDGKTSDILYSVYLKKVRKKIILEWFFKKIFYCFCDMKHLKITVRSFFKSGTIFFLKQYIGAFIDEWKNK